MSDELTIWHRANLHGNAAQLEKYWTKNPEGLAKWATTAKPFTMLVAELAKYVADPEGLAATYYHKVFHKWPGKPKGKRGGRKGGRK